MKTRNFASMFGILIMLLVFSTGSSFAQEKEVVGDKREKQVTVERKSDKTPSQDEIDAEKGTDTENVTTGSNLNAEEVKEKYLNEGNPNEVENKPVSDAPYETSTATEVETKITPKREGETKFKQVPGEADDVPVE